MTKSTITKIWVGGLIIGLAGLFVAAAGTGVMLSGGGTFIRKGPDITGFTPAFNGAFWTGVGLISFGGLGLVAGLITQFVSWIGALLNTWKLPDKLWFVLLLVLGLLRFEFVIMLVYIVAGPDGTTSPAPRMPGTAQAGPVAPAAG